MYVFRKLPTILILLIILTLILFTFIINSAMTGGCATSSSLLEPSDFNKNFSEWYYWGSVVWWYVVRAPATVVILTFKGLYFLCLGHNIIEFIVDAAEEVIRLYPSRPEDVLFVLLKAIPVIDSINALSLNPTPGITLGEWGGELMGPGWGKLTKLDLYLVKKGLEYACDGLENYNKSIPWAFEEFSYIKPRFVSLLDSDEEQFRMKQALSVYSVYQDCYTFDYLY